METTTAPNFDEALPKQELCLLFDEAITTLPAFLQPGDEQEKNDLAMFLSKVNELHKPVVGKLSASSVLNYLKRMLKHATSPTEGPSQATFTEQMQELTENIAFEIASNVMNDADLHSTTISVLNVLQEVSWESKAALIVTTFVLTFGDKGLNLCEEFKVSINEIQMFAKLKGGYKHQLESNDYLFAVVFQLIVSIVEFENLPMTYMTSKDPKVKIARSHLIVIVYWIIRIIVAAATSHIIKLSSRRNEFDKTILALREFPCRWSKNLKILNDNGHIKSILSHLQDLLGNDVDIEAYNKIKEVVEQRNHSDNMEVLNALIPSVAKYAHPLYDCLRQKKVHLDGLKGAYVLLLISGIENIGPQVDETKLNEFLKNFDWKRNNEGCECNLVWMPIIDGDRSIQYNEATKISMVKPFLDWCYIVHEKLNKVVDYLYEKPKNFKGWYSVDDPLKTSNEVRKFIRDDWKYKKGEPMIVVLDPQGNVVNHNAIYVFYIWSTYAFPFTREMREIMWDTSCVFEDVFPSIYSALPHAPKIWIETSSFAIECPRRWDFFIVRRCFHEWSQDDEIQCLTLVVGLAELTLCIHCDFSESLIVGSSLFLYKQRPLHGPIFYYGGENIEWIRSLTGMMREIEQQLGHKIIMVYVGRSHNKELMRSVIEEKLSHCLSDEFYLWLFWTRIESILYSGIHEERFYTNIYDETLIQRLQMLINCDKSNVGWAVLLTNTRRNKDPVWHGKVVLSTLKEFKLWKEKASNDGFKVGFTSHYDELYQRIFPFQRREFPNAALKAPIDTMLCPDCNNPMQQYTTFVCYHKLGVELKFEIG